MKKALNVLMALLLIMGLTWTPTIIVPSAQAVIEPELEETVLEIIRQHPEVLIESVQAYQKQQQEQQQQARQSFASQLKSKPQTIIADSPSTGSLSEKIILLEFSDFQCPYCEKAYETVKEFMDKHGDEVTLVYKHFPLFTIHPQALPAAKASWAAQQQGKFWDYYDALFEQQDNLGEDFYIELAEDLDLDMEQFERDRNSRNADLAIEKDMELAQEIGIQGTPLFIFNGQVFSGAIPLSTLEEAL
ncbi:MULTISPECIES: DsbA family protein [Crocosphaera]|uniref:DSBA oxidoreductase n=3 Tax=Crocosphaera watsonii TaxID=263511 RepID=T2JLI5_CROWT|nr:MULTISPECIES: thioredoxin domain-containing protein [Crocosphaera]MCH2246125.1 thioredoxin domain-containing protein [Crocosphaera sp.]NQZ60584.1 thioredoxin domain-containing protein [Crocosphaera sp.]CCQ53830.1 DSBA oxidoreductase [Crocosphaera watsonii WH 0005]CCQ66723.1 DSBA oxidoreductase [Crocosphaera watsonii WH 0402]